MSDKIEAAILLGYWQWPHEYAPVDLLPWNFASAIDAIRKSVHQCKFPKVHVPAKFATQPSDHPQNAKAT